MMDNTEPNYQQQFQHIILHLFLPFIHLFIFHIFLTYYKDDSNELLVSGLYNPGEGDIKPIFHLATLFARCEAKTRIRKRDWLKLTGEKICREQVGSVPSF